MSFEKIIGYEKCFTKENADVGDTEETAVVEEETK